MGVEIERKFLVRDESWRGEAGEGTEYRQGYLSVEPERTVRVRVAGDKGFLTVKGKNEGPARAEFEYEIPVSEASELLDNLALQPIIAKKRYKIQFGKYVFEIDEFAERNQGLVVVEVELESPYAVFERPKWLGKEVTEDTRYFNANLVASPFDSW